MSVEGRRIRLRDIRLDDLPIKEAWEQPGHLWLDFDAPWAPREPQVERERRLAALRETIGRGDFQDPRRRQVIALRGDDRMIGEVGWYWVEREADWAEAGLDIFDPALWGQGLGTEAFGLWCQYLLDAQPSWRRIGMSSWSGNVGMMAVATKLGMREEARFRGVRQVRGADYDKVSWAILREEWDDRYGRAPDGGFGAHLAAQPIYHLADPVDWAGCLTGEAAVYRPAAFAREGFVHCAEHRQLPGVMERHFPGREDLLLVAIDARHFVDGLRYENLEGGSELFPHLYAPIPLAAVRCLGPVAMGIEGSLLGPDLVRS